jgi:hypothetical protein
MQQAPQREERLQGTQNERARKISYTGRETSVALLPLLW